MSDDSTSYSLLKTPETTPSLSPRDLAKVSLAGELTFDASKPHGTMRKLLDVSKLASIGWQYSMPLKPGIVRAHAGNLEALK